MRNTSPTTAFLVSVCVLTVGCVGSEPRSETRVAQTTTRDAERARQENERAVDLLNAERYDAAEEALRTAIAADDTFGPAHNNLGYVGYLRRQWYLAAHHFRIAHDLMPEKASPCNNLGLVYFEVGRGNSAQLDRAIEWFGKAVELAPDDPEFIGNLARARVHRGDRDEELRALLSDLILKDTRREWVEWAREKLALLVPEGYGEKGR